MCGEYLICWGGGGVQLYQGDEIVQHLWGGCGGVCHGQAVGEVGWECDCVFQHLILVKQEVVDLGYLYKLD